MIGKGYETLWLDLAPDGGYLADLRNPGLFRPCDLGTSGLPEALRNIPVRTVVSLDAVAYLRDPRRFLNFIRRLLEANGGGTVVLTAPYHGYLKNLMLSLFDGWDDRWDALSAGGCIKCWSRYTLTRLLEESGFTNVRFRVVGGFPGFRRHFVCRADI